MSWHYRIQKKWTVYKKKKYPFYCIVEYYRPKKKGQKGGWTRDPIDPMGDSPKELIKVLEMMLHDAKKYRPFSDTSKWKPLLNEDDWRLCSKNKKK